jgi:hypothetical protein
VGGGIACAKFDVKTPDPIGYLSKDFDEDKNRVLKALDG